MRKKTAKRKKAEKLERSLKALEVFSGLKVRQAFFVRLDGWDFHALSKKLKLEKPFDKKFAQCLAETAAAFFLPFHPDMAFVFSDEISILFKKPYYFKRIEKIDSIFAGFASNKLYQLLEKRFRKKIKESVFDCRVIPVKKKEILDYLISRQSNAFQNFYNAWAQQALAKEGLKPRQIARKLRGKKIPDLVELIQSCKIDLARVPLWQKNGILIYRQPYLKKGFNPITKEKVEVERTKVKIDFKLPVFESKKGKAFLKEKRII